MTELVLSNAQIVLADTVINGSVVVRDGLVADIDDNSSSLSSATDCEGDFILPGLVELHTDNLERHIIPRPGTYWPTDAAVLSHDREMASAGITTVFNALCVGEVHSKSMPIELLNEMCCCLEASQSGSNLKSDHYLHLRCEISYGGLHALLEPLIGLSNVRLASVMNHTPGQRQYVKLEKYAEYYQGLFGFSDAELESFISDRRSDDQKFSQSNRRMVVDMADKRNIILASHDDATAEHVEEAIRDKMVISEFPTTLEAARLSHQAGLAVLMGAPNLVRGKSHSGNVSARELAEKGFLDIISSDYVPSSLLQAALMLNDHVGNIALAESVKAVSRTPALSVGLDDRGEIKRGLRADLIRVAKTSGAPVLRDVWRAGVKIA